MEISHKVLSYDLHEKDVTQFIIKNKAYLIYQDGEDIDENTTQEIFYGEIPKSKSYDEKIILGFYINETMIAIVDILQNHPKLNTWVIGLLLVDEDKRGQNRGRRIFKIVENLMKSHQVMTIRLGVLEDNSLGKSFWERNGFSENGESKLHADGRTILVMEKKIVNDNIDDIH